MALGLAQAVIALKAMPSWPSGGRPAWSPSSSLRRLRLGARPDEDSMMEAITDMPLET